MRRTKTLLDRADEAAASLTGWVDQRGLGFWLRLLAFVGVPLWGLALDHDLVQNTRAKVGGFVLAALLFVLGLLLERHRFTAQNRTLRQRLGRVNGSLSGNLHTLANHLHEVKGWLTEEQSKGLCRSFLARTKDLAYTALEMSDEAVRLRAVLVLPILDGNEYKMQVWCYDQPYADRKWSRMPMTFPGAPEAYRSGSVRLLSDIRQLPNLLTHGPHGFQSAICFPVLSLPGRNPLGVVCLDAPEPNYFDIEDADRLYAYVGPSIEAIGVVLQLRNPDARLSFR